MEFSDQALGVSHEVLAAVPHGVDSFIFLELLGKAALFGMRVRITLDNVSTIVLVQCVLPSQMALSRAGMKALRVS